jgi:hypothetical protein
LGIPPIKGILVISLIENGDKKKLVISKADYNEFLDVLDYRKKQGFPIKKKIYKAFLANIDGVIVEKVAVYDTNPIFTVYWYRDFLELKKIHTDEHNTEEVFKIIEQKVLNPLKKDHKADYFELWNASVRYFRVKEEFILNDYVEDILTKHQAHSKDLDIEVRVTNLRNTIERHNVDARFKIISQILNKKLKNSISLTQEIELKIKDSIPNLEKIIKSVTLDDDSKWVMIRSDEGYEYFKDKNE